MAKNLSTRLGMIKLAGKFISDPRIFAMIDHLWNQRDQMNFKFDIQANKVEFKFTITDPALIKDATEFVKYVERTMEER